MRSSTIRHVGMGQKTCQRSVMAMCFHHVHLSSYPKAPLFTIFLHAARAWAKSRLPGQDLA